MQWSYWFTPSEDLWSVGIVNGQGITIGIDSDWPTREQAQRRVVLLNGGDPAGLERAP